MYTVSKYDTVQCHADTSLYDYIALRIQSVEVHWISGLQLLLGQAMMQVGLMLLLGQAVM